VESDQDCDDYTRDYKTCRGIGQQHQSRALRSFRASWGEQGELTERSTHPKPARTSIHLGELLFKSMAGTSEKLGHEDMGSLPADGGLPRQEGGADNLVGAGGLYRKTCC
jgi:hypothetical protein